MGENGEKIKWEGKKEGTAKGGHSSYKIIWWKIIAMKRKNMRIPQKIKVELQCDAPSQLHGIWLK